MVLYYALLAFSWLVFGAIHSLTASFSFKNWVQSRIGYLNPYYRLIYNGVAGVTFVPVLLVLWLSPTDPIRFGAGSVWLGWLLLILGTGLGIYAFSYYDTAEFLGWPLRKPSDGSDTLRQDGLLQYVRHPLYLATLVALAGLLFLTPDLMHLLFFLFAFLYIRIGIYFEERKLTQVFGHAYKHFQKRVPMLIPSFW